MCGICGVVGSARSDVAESIVRRMMAAMWHRGPDDEGLFVTPPGARLGPWGAAVGMRRLSIIDLPGGHQPVFNEEQDVAVVFNGEIYNFQELRLALEARGHVFRTRSDTEVIVHAYETWGEDCVDHLRGMFAFAVLDLRQGPAARTASPDPNAAPRVFLARDRLGIKPLYYAVVNGALLFASEVRALLESGWVSPRLSAEALESYLLFGSVAEPTTLVEDIRSLPPGWQMVVPLASGEFGRAVHPSDIRRKAYWNIGEAARPSPTPVKRARGAIAEQLRLLLEDVVRSHLIADVPLGIFLSSGIDSTALTALASRQRRNVHTFTVVFPEQDFSEGELARQTAERFGTQHQELQLSGEEMQARLEEAVSSLDQPTMDGINMYIVSWGVRQAGLKVALSGLGGDEIFGGYRTFHWTPHLARLATLGGFVPRAVRSATAAIVVKLREGSRHADAARKLAALWRNPDALPHAYFYTRAVFPCEQVAALLNGAAAREESLWRARLEEAARQAVLLGKFTGVSCLETQSYLVNTLLRDTDAVSMSHSLEVRVPLLDHRLVEFVAQLPESVKRRRGTPKALLVDALGKLLPAEVVHQPKRTFTFPWQRWLHGALGAKVAAGLADLAPALRPILNRNAVQAVWGDFLAGRTSWSRPWSLYVLNEWCRRHLQGSNTEFVADLRLAAAAAHPR